MSPVRSPRRRRGSRLWRLTSNGVRPFQVEPAARLKGEINLSGDKSIAHRSLIIAAVSQGKTVIENFPANKDCLSTVSALQKLGVRITRRAKNVFTVYGKGRYGLSRSRGALFVGNSGTTLRLLLGVLAGQDFATKLTAGKSLSRRPMLRVTAPLRLMGAQINAKISAKGGSAYGGKTQNSKQEEYPPIIIKGGSLKPITYRMPVASAQVKSAILLAGLYAKGATTVIEPLKTRDHTERMLKLFKAEIKLKQNKIVIKGNRELVSPKRIYIPGDISSASFFLVMASIVPHSRILIKKVSLNPTRTGIIRVLKRMGADIQVLGVRCQVSGTEPMGDIVVKSSKLKGTIVKRKEIPSLIDELPVLMVAASVAKGKTVFEGVNELRVKETDRIRAMSENLKKMGAAIKVVKKGILENIIIRGVKSLKGVKVSSFGDHRTAMSLVIAGLIAKSETLIDDIGCINKSFPDFLNLLNGLLP